MSVAVIAIGGTKAWYRRFFAAVAAAGLVFGFVDGAVAALDWGQWTAGLGTYLNGDTINITLGPKTGFFDNSSTSNAVGGPSDQPTSGGQYAHFANLIADSRPLPTWTVTIDLSNYDLSSQTVFAFANLGAGIASGTQTATIVFRDAATSPLSLTSATLVGGTSFDHQWAGSTFNDPATFVLSTNTWSYAAGNGGVEGASAIFFLTNLPTNAASIVFTVNNPSDLANYQGDSIFFAVGSPIQTDAVPEPATLALWTLGALGCAIARYRRNSPA